MRIETVAALLSFASTAFAAKAGLAWPWYNENSNLDPSRFSGDGKVSWMYNWETWRPANTNGVNFVGTQRCMDCESSPIGELAARAADQGWTDVFTLNEPDLNGISAGEAASWYQSNIAPLSTKKALPSVTSSTDGGMGLNWLSDFLNACGGGCPHDYINLHWYGRSADEFKSHISSALDRFPGSTIIVTEFALEAPASADDQAAFFRDTTSWLEGQSSVAMYFPFVATSPGLLSSNDGAAAGYVGTGSSLFNDDGSVSASGDAVLA